MTIAEESTAFPGVTRPVHLGGVGFHFKWNMGWMNDTLHYFEKDPVSTAATITRKITFSFMYAWTENFVLPISHDEVVHGKSSLLDKMPGDEWQTTRQLPLVPAFMTAHPGKKLMFMGTEFGQWQEWRDEQLDWPLLEQPAHRALHDYDRELNQLYASRAVLHASDCDPAGSAGSTCTAPTRAFLSSCARSAGADTTAARLRVQLHAGAARWLLDRRSGSRCLPQDSRQ